VTTAGRVAAVETALGPTEIVLHILAEAREFASLEAYTRSIIDQPDDAAPLDRITAAAEASVRAAMKGASRQDIDVAVRHAVGDGIFTFVLVLQLNGAALDIARVEGLRASATFFWMGSLLGGPRERDREPADRAEHSREQVSAWHSWRSVVAGLVATRTIEEDAREQLEACYLAGQSSLLPDAEGEWSSFAELVDRIWSLAENLVPLSRAEERRASKEGAQLFDDRVRDRARKLADDARISTFDRLGENSRALAILERRLERGVETS